MITGELNPAKYLPVIRRELENAGINTIISEKQAQLNQYLKGEKKS